MVITYDQCRPEIDDIIAIYQSSGIKRPVQDADRIREMYRHANLVITAWDGEKPVGIARALHNVCGIAAAYDGSSVAFGYGVA